MNWYVEYEVKGFGEHRAGPYDLAEAARQRDDIAGYEGVVWVRLAIDTAADVQPNR